MRVYYPYLSDKQFLKSFSEEVIKEEFVKITLLDQNEEPIQEIQSNVASGSLNLNGSSTMRRTGNLTLALPIEELKLNEAKSIFSINKKIFLEKGLKNTTSQWKQYPIIWFPLGIYFIFDPSFSYSTSNLSISISLKDKMCLLNGECGGTLPAAVTFHESEYFDKTSETWVTEYPLIKQIIKECVNHYGNISENQIFIYDVDEKIKQVLRWNGTSAIYRTVNKNIENNKASYDFKMDKTSPNDQVINPGTDIGYTYTEFTYPGELIAAAGDSVCSVLDKIVQTLGNYEYYFDVYGNFIFQEIKNYLNTTLVSTSDGLFNPTVNPNYQLDYTIGKRTYEFPMSTIISINVNPSYENVKNDFIVWGKRKLADESEVPIRFHLAIDEKPVSNKVFSMDGWYWNEEERIFLRLNNGETLADRVPDEEKQQLYRQLTGSESLIRTTDWRANLYMDGLFADQQSNVTAYNDYYIELLTELPKVYDIKQGTWDTFSLIDLDFWLDIIDSDKLSSISVKEIGRRTHVVNDDSINCIFEPKIPALCIIDKGDTDKNKKELENLAVANNLDFCVIDANIYANCALGGIYNSAFVMIQDLLYQYTNYNESLSISALPVYYIEPNIRIGLSESIFGVSGDFMIQSISLPLGIDGTMSISAIAAKTKI